MATDLQRLVSGSPTVEANTVVLQLALTAGGGASLSAAISTAATAASVTLAIADIRGLLISAGTGNDVFIRQAGGTGLGLKITAGNSLYLPVAAWPNTTLNYECASTVGVMIFR